MPEALLAAGFSDGIETDVGDLFSWLESGVESAIKIVEDAAEGVWHFVASIAGKIYYGVLDCVEKVAGAVMWLYNAIKVVIEDIILFLEFLFGWQDILTTHRVLKNVFLQMGQYAIDGLGASKGKIAPIFTQLQAEINKWADIPGFDQTPGGTASANPPLAGQSSAPSNLGVHHFQGNCSSSSTSYSPLAPAEAIFQDLITLLSNEQTVLTQACDAIKTQIIDQFSSLSVSEIIKRFVGIVADTVLASAENVLTTLLDVLAQVVAGMIDALNATIDIPVLSWLYKLLTGDNLSFLDLACLIAAIPVTLIFKATAGAAPFARGDAFTTGLIGATSFAQIQAQFLVSRPTGERRALMSASAGAVMAFTAADDAPVLDQAKLKVFGIVAGVASLVGSVVLVITSAIQKTADTFGLPIALTKTLATITCVGNILYVSPNIATLINAGSTGSDAWYSQLNNVLTGISIVKGMAAIPLANTESSAIKIMFPAVETVINVVWNVPVIANIVVNGSAWNSTYKSLIPESIGDFAFNLGGMMELPIALTKVPGGLELAVVQAGLMLSYGAMMVVAGGIYEWTSDQHH